jgi:transcriptional regulator with XRE-family HTH domain/molybdate-binding protein
MFGERLRRLRLARGLTQVQLAELAEVSRQLIGAVEADRHLPRVDAAVRLAAALSTSVEELLASETRNAMGVLAEPEEGALVRIGRVGDRLVSVPAAGSGEGWASADAQVRDGSVQLFDAERPALVVAGCDPIIGLASRLLETTSGPRVVPVATSSARAAEVLAAGRCHAVTVHGLDTSGFEPPIAVRRWHIARWQVGLAAPADLGAGWRDDALAGRIPVVHREDGASSQAAFERARQAEHRPGTSIVGPRAGGHAEAAWRAATDRMVAVTIEPAALANGLVFHPLEAHTSELWVSAKHADYALFQAFLTEVTGERVHRRLAAIGGYDLSDNGMAVAA